MIKSELVLHIANANPHLYRRDVENIVNAILGEITNAMAKATESNCAASGPFRLSTVRPTPAATRAPALMSRSSRSQRRFSNSAKKCANV
jgi:integration host factor subunit beta